MEKNAKQIKAAKARQEEAVLNRVLIWLAGGAALEFLLLLLNRYYNNYTVSMLELSRALRVAVKVAAVVGLAGTAAFTARWTAQKRKGESGLWSGIGALFLLGLSLSCLATWIFGPNGLRFSYVAVPVVIVLVLVYYLYQREFFFQSWFAALSLIGVWIMGGGLQTAACAYAAVAVALIGAGAYVCWKVQKNKGKAKIRNRDLHLFTRDTNYTLLYAGAAVNTAVLIAAVLLAPAVVLYGVAAAWVLIMAVYYTVKII